MACNLGSHTRLGPQTRDSNYTGQHPPYLSFLSDCPEFRRVGEKSTVLVVHDEDGQIGVRISEFGVELRVEGAVYGCPE